MTDALGPGGLAAIVGNSDPEFTDLFRAALRPYDKALVARIRGDARAGRFRRDLDADGVVSLMFGAYLGQLVRHGRVTSGWLDRSMEMIWLVMTSTDTHGLHEGDPPSERSQLCRQLVRASTPRLSLVAQLSGPL